MLIEGKRTIQLTRYTDYSLRVLLYLSLNDDGATISEIASRYGISRNHLVKVVHNLSLLGYIKTSRGRGGGLKLALPPDEINLGRIVRQVEPHFVIVECLCDGGGRCPITPVCELRGVIRAAREAFMDVLNSYTLASLCSNSEELLDALGAQAH